MKSMKNLWGGRFSKSMEDYTADYNESISFDNILYKHSIMAVSYTHLDVYKRQEYEMEIDTVVVAIGQGPNPLVPKTTPGLILTKKGNIQADDATGQTSRENVFAGGDIVTGAATVILAMGAGKRAARAIDQYLQSLE